MSVRGEFRRTVGETLACLREAEDAATRRRAEPLERALECATRDLEGAARQLLAGWRDDDPTDLDPASRRRLREASERMLAIARIILGVPG